MADIADDAQESIERALYLAQVLRKRENLPTGSCLECGEDTPGSFCCPECRDDYQKRQKMAAISGKK
jgi:hypothetical protein